MKKYLDWASREYTMRQRMIALVPLAFLFLLILPLLLVRGSVPGPKNGFVEVRTDA